MSSEDQKSSGTGSGVINQIVGTVQDAIGQLTGSGQNQSEGKARQNVGQDQVDASRTAAKVGPFTATAEGGAHVDSQKRQEGSWQQTIGNAYKVVGDLTGSESLKQQGIQQYEDGVQKQREGQAEDLTQGVTDRVKGGIGATAAGFMGNTRAQAEFQEQHDGGKAGQRSVEADLRKEADAEQKRREQNQYR